MIFFLFWLLVCLLNSFFSAHALMDFSQVEVCEGYLNQRTEKNELEQEFAASRPNKTSEIVNLFYAMTTSLEFVRNLFLFTSNVSLF